MAQAAAQVGADYERSLAQRVLDALGNLLSAVWDALTAVASAVARADIAPLAAPAAGLQMLAAQLTGSATAVAGEITETAITTVDKVAPLEEIRAGIAAVIDRLLHVGDDMEREVGDPQTSAIALPAPPLPLPLPLPPFPILPVLVIIGAAILLYLFFKWLMDRYLERVRPIPKEKTKERRRACVLPGSIDLPPPRIVVDPNALGPGFGAPFRMGMTFIHHPATGCDATIGEYRQYVRGTMQRDFGTGVLKDRRPPCMKNFNAFKLEEDKGMVDGDCHPYGHRAGVNTDNDQYLPLRSSGPMYSGSDYPNVGRLEPGEHAWLVLHFFGETVDTLNGGLAQGGTQREWDIVGTF